MRNRAPINCDHQTNRFERAIYAADCSTKRGSRTILEPTSLDKIELGAVIQRADSISSGDWAIIYRCHSSVAPFRIPGVRSAEGVSFASIEKEK
jgi:hypothetical protein